MNSFLIVNHSLNLNPSETFSSTTLLPNLTSLPTKIISNLI